MNIKDLVIDLRERDIKKVVEALHKYEAIRYGNDYGLGFDASVKEVLKQMKLEK